LRGSRFVRGFLFASRVNRDGVVDVISVCRAPLLDHLIGAGEKRGRHLDAKRLGDLEIEAAGMAGADSGEAWWGN
jgi:hypothetical protein